MSPRPHPFAEHCDPPTNPPATRRATSPRCATALTALFIAASPPALSASPVALEVPPGTVPDAATAGAPPTLAQATPAQRDAGTTNDTAAPLPTREEAGTADDATAERARAIADEEIERAEAQADDESADTPSRSARAVAEEHLDDMATRPGDVGEAEPLSGRSPAAAEALADDRFSDDELLAFRELEARVEQLDERWKKALTGSGESGVSIVDARTEARRERASLLQQHGLDARRFREIRTELMVDPELRERLDRLAADQDG